MIILWKELGISSLAGLLIIIIMMPVSGYFSKIIKKIQRSIMNYKDNRIKSTNEVLSNMKTVKLQTWEESFKNKVSSIRKEELSLFIKKFLYNCVSTTLWGGIPAIVAAVTFTCYTLLGNKLTVAKAFTSLSLYIIIYYLDLIYLECHLI